MILLFFTSISFAKESLDLLLELDKGMPGTDNFGYSVSYAGDFDKDGYDDIIVGYPSNNQGSAYIYCGGKQMDVKADFTIIGRNGEGSLGRSVSFVGDVDSDGFTDIIIGAYNTGIAGEYTTGKAILYFGTVPYAFDTLSGLTFSDGKLGSGFGNCVKYIGDFNNDKYDDFIISAFLDNKNGTQAGRAYLYFGGPSLGTIPEIIFTGKTKFNFFGESVTSAGDVNNDGFSDVAIGARGYEVDGEKVGRVYIYYGNNTLDSNPDVVITGSRNKRIGSTIACAGDINNDGFDDIIVGAPYMGSAIGPSSYVYIYYGETEMDNKADVIVETTLFNFGKSASSAGDINNDDYDDIMICDDTNVYFYFGGSEMDTIPDITLNINNYTYFDGIQSISLAGDVNNDGYKDILISAIEPVSEDTRIGKVYIYSVNFDITAIKSSPVVSKSFALYQNYPNPFNPLTTIKYNLEKSNDVILKIYNLSGQEMETLVNGFQTSGEHEITWQPRGLPNGIYFYRLQAGEFLETKKLILEK
jgi:hypothetical protein